MGRAHPLSDVTVLDLEGRPVRVGDLWKERRAVLVFVRHFGCLFCRQQVAELTPYLDRIRATGADVFLVGNGTVDDARAFNDEGPLQMRVLTDPTREVYRILETRRPPRLGFLDPVLAEEGEAGGDGGPEPGCIDRLRDGDEGHRLRSAAGAHTGGGDRLEDPGPGGGECRHQAGRAGADHQHVTMGVGLLVLVRVRQLRRGAEAGGAADDRLVDLLPEALRPHEGLVVEAGHEHLRGQRIDRPHIEAERGPAVLAPGDKPVIELDHGGTGIGFLPSALAQFDQGVGLGGAGGDDAARAGVDDEPERRGRSRMLDRDPRENQVSDAEASRASAISANRSAASG